MKKKAAKKKKKAPEAARVEQLPPPQVGRPTDYRDEYPEMLLKHFLVEPFEIKMERHIEYFPNGKVKTATEKPSQKVMNRLPTLFNFSRSIGVDYTTAWRWAHNVDPETSLPIHPEFCKAYKEAKELQKEFLMALGLSGLSPASSYIFTAKNITDMRDEQESVVTHNFSLTQLFFAAQDRRKQIAEESEEPGK